MPEVRVSTTLHPMLPKSNARPNKGLLYTGLPKKTIKSPQVTPLITAMYALLKSSFAKMVAPGPAIVW
jgi:hypothetical protein